MASKNLKLTSVKIVDHLFDDFKVSSIRHKFNLQKLVNRSVNLYLTDEEFRKFGLILNKLKELKKRVNDI